MEFSFVEGRHTAVLFFGFMPTFLQREIHNDTIGRLSIIFSAFE
jgi:hypothetical protein